MKIITKQLHFLSRRCCPKIPHQITNKKPEKTKETHKNNDQ